MVRLGLYYTFSWMPTSFCREQTHTVLQHGQQTAVYDFSKKTSQQNVQVASLENEKA